MSTLIDQLNESAEFIKSKTQLRPTIGVVLGSGLGEFANYLEDKIEIPYQEIPGFKKTTIIGHEGKLLIGKIGSNTVAVMQGRIHAYEGHSLEEVVFPVRVLGTLGIKNIILTNAAGGINTNYRPGQLVLIEDHLNLTGNSPLVGPNHSELGTRFPDMSFAWHPELREVAKEAAKKLGYKLEQGVYAGVLGPCYETPAEIRMFRNMGADVVGMSTVSENIAAVHMGIRVLGISCVTNMAAGIEKVALNHDDIKDQANQVMKTFCDLLTQVIHAL